MNNSIETAVTKLREIFGNLTMQGIETIRAVIESLGADPEVKDRIRRGGEVELEGTELYRDKKDGFILIAYGEREGTYRIPHNHGESWVVYAVISGEIEMKSYFNAVRMDGSDRLVMKSREVLGAGDSRVYYPGEIHDTRCISAAEVLRLTSLDLREEERSGRMRRFQPNQED